MAGPPQPGRQDPAAVAVLIGIVLIGLVCGGFLLRTFLAAERSADTASRSFTDVAARAFERAMGALRELQGDTGASPPRGPVVLEPAKDGRRPADPKRVFPAVAAPAAPHVLPPFPRGVWVYDVSFGPRWSYQGQLHYRTRPAEAGKVGADTSWAPRNGSSTSNWYLGTFEANHASHGNTRFPGFFMHPAYFPAVLEPGNRLRWELPWLYAGPAGEPGWVRRYEMKVAGWETVDVPAGTYEAARLEGTLRYVEPARTAFEIRCTLWYAPRARQVVRVLWLGVAPDESHPETIVELSFHADKAVETPVR